MARVQQGKMSLGIKGELFFAQYNKSYIITFCFQFYMSAKNGVVIATDKKVTSTLVDLDEYEKMQSITPSTGK